MTSRRATRKIAVAALAAGTALVCAGPASAASAGTAPARPAAATSSTGSPVYGSTVQLLPQEQWGAAIARVEAYDGRLGLVRIFQSVPDPSILTPLGSRGGVFSFDLPPAQVLSGAYDAKFKAFFAAAPAGRTTWWSYYHEADVAYNQGSLTNLQQFRDAYTHLALLARAAGPKLKNTLILVGYTANPQSGMTVSQFMPRADLVDAVSWDNYNGWFTRQGYYGDPAGMVAFDRSAAASVGKPFAVAEFGSVVLGRDTVGRADWIRQFAKDAAGAGALFVSYFDSNTYGRGAEYRLLDAPSQKAYRDVLGGTPLSAPAAPDAVAVSSGDGSATVSWQPPDDHGSPVTGYTVTATDPTGNTTPVSVLPASTAVILSPLADGQSYTVVVAAQNALGTGAASTAQTVVPGTVVGAPDAPTSPTAVPGNGAATLSWTAPVSNGGSSLTGYTVTAVDAQSGTSTGTTAVTPDSGSATVTGLTNGRSYVLQVTANNSAGNSPPAQAAPTTPYTGPGAPTLGRVTAGNVSLTATWTPPADTGGAPITGYVLTALHQGVAQASTTVDGNTTSGTVSGLTNGTTYQLTVTALNGATGSPSAPSAPTIPATVPSAPATTAGGGSTSDSVISATTWWKWPTSTGGSNITGFRVATYHYVNGVLVSTTLSAVQPWNAWQLQVVGLVRQDAYQFSVQAINGVGASAWSTPSNTVRAY